MDSTVLYGPIVRVNIVQLILFASSHCDLVDRYTCECLLMAPRIWNAPTEEAGSRTLFGELPSLGENDPIPKGTRRLTVEFYSNSSEFCHLAFCRHGLQCVSAKWKALSVCMQNSHNMSANRERELSDGEGGKIRINVLRYAVCGPVPNLLLL